MSQSNNFIVGLDIGTTKICAIVGQLAENGKFNILGMGKAASQGGVSRGMVANVSKAVLAIEEAIKDAEKHSQVNIKTVYVGIAGHHIKSLQHRGTLSRRHGDEEIEQSELDKLENEMQNLALTPGLEILHVGRIGVRLECNYHIITGETAAAKTIFKAVSKAGLKVADLMVEPVASARAVLSDAELEAGVALVDIGGGTTDICIFENGFISHTAIIPIGGDRITRDLQEAFGILKEQAEDVKVKYGSCYPTENMKNEVVVIPGLPGRLSKEISVFAISQVIRARMEDIIQKVDFEIQVSGIHSKLSGGVVLTGGGSSMKDVSQLFNYQLGLEVHLGSPGQHLGKGLIDEVRNPMYSTAIGLVMMGFDSSEKVGTEFEPNVKINKTEAPQSKVEMKQPDEVIIEPDQKTKAPGIFKGLWPGIVSWLGDDTDDFKGN